MVTLSNEHIHSMMAMQMTGNDRYYLIRTAPRLDVHDGKSIRRDSGWRLGHRSDDAAREHFLARTNQTYDEFIAAYTLWYCELRYQQTRPN
jgi:hypothetical protein